MTAAEAARKLDEAVKHATDDESIDEAIRVAIADGLPPDDAKHIARERCRGNDPGVGQAGPAAAPSWPEPDMHLVEDDRAPAPTLDDDALPAGWEGWIAAEAEARACPRDYVAAGLIGAVSAWIGNARRVAATAAWTEPAHLWIALIGVPSAGKTPALKPVIEASSTLEREAQPAWHQACAKHERDAEAAKAIEEAWRDEVREAARAGLAPPDRPPGAAAPTAPPPPRVMSMDSSTEKLQQLLAENPRGLLHVRDELAGWLGGFDRYGGGGADRAFYLESWNGGAYVCDRVKHKRPVRIEHASLAILGGMVPDRLREALAEADDGLAARMIFIWPEPAPIASLKNGGGAGATARHERLLIAARRLAALAMGSDDRGVPAPRALRLDPDAFALFDEQQQDARRQARAASGLSAGWHGKNPGRTLRLSLVFELLTWAGVTTTGQNRQQYRRTPLRGPAAMSIMPRRCLNVWSAGLPLGAPKPTLR